jgi:exodeoxyribonuclease V alpha subunit
LLILPDKESPLLTRELVYTGLTRARTRVEVWFEEAALRAAVAAKIQRGSGLRDRLRTNP